MPLTWVDYSLLGLVGISGLLGLLRGFVRELLSLMTWVASVWVAIHFSDHFAPHLENLVEPGPLRKAAAFCILLFASLVVGALLGAVVGKLLSSAGLSGTDRLVGLVFGLMRGGLLVALLLAVAERTPMPQAPWWKQSVVIPWFKPVTGWIGSQLQQGEKLIGSAAH